MAITKATISLLYIMAICAPLSAFLGFGLAVAELLYMARYIEFTSKVNIFEVSSVIFFLVSSVASYWGLIRNKQKS